MIVGEHSGIDYIKHAIVLIIILLVLNRTASVYAREHRLSQKAAAESQFMVEHSAGNDDCANVAPESYVLFARPFSSEGQVTAATDNLGILSPAGHTDGSSQSLEAVLSRAFGDVRVLGGGEDVIGPLRIQTEHDWRSTFIEMARAAKLIVVLLLDGVGTDWEIKWLKVTGLLERTIVVMPKSSFQTPHNAGQKWEASRLSLLKAGFEIPPYDKNGAYLYFHDGEFRAYSLKNYNVYALRDLAHLVQCSFSVARSNIWKRISFSFAISSVIALVWALLRSESGLGLGLIAVPVMPFILFPVANLWFETKFGLPQFARMGIVWPGIFLMYFFGTGIYGTRLMGEIDSSAEGLEMLISRYHLVVNGGILAAVISLSCAKLTFDAVITVGAREVIRFAMIWVWLRSLHRLHQFSLGGAKSASKT